MSNIFDRLKVTTFDIVARTMGYDCFWGQLQARVMFRKPTEQERLNDQNYTPRMYVMEYKIGDLTGLFESVRAKNSETVTIENTDYYVRDVQATTDGDLYNAQLIPV